MSSFVRLNREDDFAVVAKTREAEMDAFECRTANPGPSFQVYPREVSLRRDRHATENRPVEVGEYAPVSRNQAGMDVSCVVDHGGYSRIWPDTVKPWENPR